MSSLSLLLLLLLSLDMACATPAVSAVGENFPLLTPWQRGYHQQNSRTAEAAAARARPALLGIMRNKNFTTLLTEMGLADIAILTAEEQLGRFANELQLAEVTHGFQASVAALMHANAAGQGFHDCANCGDVDLAVEQQATYLHNLWELTSLGLRCTPDGNGTRGSGNCFTEDWLRGCDQSERGLFCAGENRTHCFPSFSRTIPHGVEWSQGPESWPANMAESVERPVYHAINFHRTDHGISQFGSISVVMNMSYVAPISFLVPMDSGDFEGGCNHTNQQHFVSCNDADLQHNATKCNATVPSWGNKHCVFYPAYSFGPSHKTQPARCDWPPRPPDPMFDDLPHVCHGFELHHSTYLNGTILESFYGPNASSHCCSACQGWNGSAIDKQKKALCDGWQISGGKDNLDACFTIKRGTGVELPNVKKILSGRINKGGGWHRRAHNCSAWQPHQVSGQGGELGTFSHWEHTLLGMLYCERIPH